MESATESQEIGVSLILDSIAKAFYREHRFSIGFKAPSISSGTGQITYLGTRYAVDIREEVIARYTQRIDSVVDRYLEKLPVQPDVGIWRRRSNGNKRYRELQAPPAHGSEPAMANAVGYWYFGSSAR